MKNTNQSKPIPPAAASPDSDDGGQAAPMGSVPLVAIGASAGGLEALESFFSNVPPHCGMAFVVIQHFAPGHRSMMDSILAKHTAMKVLMIEEGMVIAPDTIFLPPSGHAVEIVQEGFHLSVAGDIRAENLPIDHLFRSLAQSRKHMGVCVVLSGTGSDGTLGVRAIKEVGGMALVQETRQAKYSGMPQSAIDTGLVDFVVPVEKMAETIAQYIRNPFISRVHAPPQELPEQTQKALGRIFTLLNATMGHDFSGYKQTTIRRRIERRMAVNGVESMEDYAKLLERNGGELQLLFNDILIGVTRFFRDPEAYDALARKALAPLLLGKSEESELRVWVVGCATGEEAYSLAMVLTEMIEQSHKRISLQIFASDIDSRAIEFARQGLYPASIAPDVSSERLQRFFTHDEAVYRIKKSIRDSVVFAMQDVAKDPPFSRVDVLSCRNLLIYMDRDLQNKVLPVFHYALCPNGILFLGTSESVGDLTGDFRPLDTRYKIYQKVGSTASGAPMVRMHERIPAMPPVAVAGKIEAPLRTLGARLLLDEFTPPAVLVTERMEVRHFYGEVDKFLSLTAGEASLNVLQIARSGLRPRLAAALAQALRDNAPVRAQGVRLSSGAELLTLDVVVQPVIDSPQGSRLMLVVFKERTRQRSKTAAHSDENLHQAGVSEVDALALELKATKEYLQTTIEELQTSNEELRSTNEELQSSNEELESSREELQSTNEELSTVNSELQSKVDELTQKSNDLNNFLSSTDIATIFLDTELRIKRFTPTAVKVFRLQDSDIGRPMRDITSQIVAFDIYEAAAEVLNTLLRKDVDVAAEGGRWFSVRILPYRTVDFTIEGVVLTCSEITELKQALDKYESAESLARGIVNALPTPFVVLDTALMVRAANDPFYELFRVRSEDTLGRPLAQLGSGQWSSGLLKDALEAIVLKDMPLEHYSVHYDFPQIGLRTMLLNGRRIANTQYVYVSIENAAELEV